MSPDFARVDLSRASRCGRSEAIFCEGKLPDEVAAIAVRLRTDGQPALTLGSDRLLLGVQLFGWRAI